MKCLIAACALTLSAQTIPTNWNAARLPFSFVYDSRPSAQLLPHWLASHRSAADHTDRYLFTDPATHLTVIADVRSFPEFPGALDYVLYFQNNGVADTPIVEDILPLDWSIAARNGEALIHHARGSDARANDFEPLEEPFRRGQSVHLESPGGDPSSRNSLPFFNLDTGRSGLIVAVGWTGDWKADFFYPQDGHSIALRAGMKRTHFLLHPGEQVRTPRIVLLSWAGDDWRQSQNIWRRLLLAHYTPQEHGQPMLGPVLFASWGSEPMADKIAYVQWVREHRIPVELYAVDAGWYGASVGAETDPTNPWWKNRGDWFPSPLYYPRGIRPLGEAIKAAGFGFSLWIEPETTMPGRQIAVDHPDWFLHSDRPFNNGVMLANLGDPKVEKGITDLVSHFISDFEMTWYRQDFNIPPERYWELADTPDRIGIAQIKHIEALYRMWDRLLAAHPGLHIDNCASGGRRIDIEMMSRSFVVWRTDHGFQDTLAEQAQTQALALWVPENMGFETYTLAKPWLKPGPYSTPESLYQMRLGYNAGYGLGPGEAGLNNPGWDSWIRNAIAEYREVQPYIYDFYPLLPYSRDNQSWTAWQWYLPGPKKGIAILLRRPGSPFPLLDLQLNRLSLEATYEVQVRTTYDRPVAKRMKGTDLAHLQISLPEAPSSAIVFYRQLSN